MIIDNSSSSSNSSCDDDNIIILVTHTPLIIYLFIFIEKWLFDTTDAYTFIQQLGFLAS